MRSCKGDGMCGGRGSRGESVARRVQGVRSAGVAGSARQWPRATRTERKREVYGGWTSPRRGGYGQTVLCGGDVDVGHHGRIGVQWFYSAGTGEQNWRGGRIQLRDGRRARQVDAGRDGGASSQGLACSCCQRGAGTETGVRSGLHGTGVAHGRRVRQRGGCKGGRMGGESAAARRLRDGYSDAGAERAQQVRGACRRGGVCGQKVRMRRRTDNGLRRCAPEAELAPVPTRELARVWVREMDSAAGRIRKEREEKRTGIPLTNGEFEGSTHTRYLRSGGAARLQVAPATGCVFASVQNRRGTYGLRFMRCLEVCHWRERGVRKTHLSALRPLFSPETRAPRLWASLRVNLSGVPGKILDTLVFGHGGRPNNDSELRAPHQLGPRLVALTATRTAHLLDLPNFPGFPKQCTQLYAVFSHLDLGVEMR
ncbi:hypothetical protein B0H14DRAFT_3164530 [Mycena olivaceomarginata]|nr:hypothetical protein B0H14DRAFT_3164530 [Mycena olivaceomarginata]